ncbi:MAG: Nif3-like dinuclear metal center hexameric protein [Gemmatales bacterium]
MPTPLHIVCQVLERIAPLSLAESWDNVGLLLGDEAQSVDRIMTCLTITPDVVEEGIAQQVDLIVSHHPVLFKPVQRLSTRTKDGRLLLPLIRNNIAVYSAHTAYDNAAQGINQQLAYALGLQHIRALTPASGSKQYKIAVFVPDSHLDIVAEAMFAAGAGRIGNYSQCSFRTAGTGTFQGNEHSNPTIGQAGQLESVSEVKLEVVCPQSHLAAVLAAMKAAHVYEEPAFDVYLLHDVAGSALGSGRMGEFPVPISAEALGLLVASKLQCNITLTGYRSHSAIRRVAVVCGAGGSMLPQAIQAGADAFLTGEARFHDELAAQAAGLALVVAGHFATERPGIEQLAVQLESHLPDCTIWASSAEQNPAVSVACPAFQGSP